MTICENFMPASLAYLTSAVPAINAIFFPLEMASLKLLIPSGLPFLTRKASPMP